MTDRPSTETSDHVVRQLLEATQEGFWHIDVNGLTIDVNPAMCRILGRPREDVLGRSIFDFVDTENERIFHQQLALRKRGLVGPYEIALQRPDGTNVPCINNATPVVDEQGVRTSSIGLWTEITEIKAHQHDLEQTTEAAEQAADEARQRRASLEAQVKARTVELQSAVEALQSSQESYRLLTDVSPNAMFVQIDGFLVYANPEMVRLMEVDTADDILGIEAIKVVAPESRASILRLRDVLTVEPSAMDSRDIVYQTMKGNRVDVVTGAANTTWNGKPATLVVAQDVTQQRRLEEQLRQAQRLEAVGQLTGGIAHDFNNLLAVIQGNVEFLEDEIGTDNKLLQSISRASRRGAELTQRLLAFSRKQQLQPTALDIFELVEGLHQLLDRTLGENIKVRVSADGALWPAMVDPGQLENVILNLAINSRDAMPDGGTLTIECRNQVIENEDAALHTDATPGEYAVLSVRDTGTGMPDEVRARAFEPFFTTKEVGKGSGLGLSMVYGFVRQSGGHITIDSEAGVGTTVTLYLPKADSMGKQQNTPVPRDSAAGRGEHILVVEDDADVRSLVTQTLTGIGYRVTDVSAAEEGLSLIPGESFDLILSDVVLPGQMTGLELVDAAQALNPNIAALLMSGYPADAMQQTGHTLLRKPFRREHLAVAVHEALSRPAGLKTAER